MTQVQTFNPTSLKLASPSELLQTEIWLVFINETLEQTHLKSFFSRQVLLFDRPHALILRDTQLINYVSLTTCSFSCLNTNRTFGGVIIIRSCLRDSLFPSILTPSLLSAWCLWSIKLSTCKGTPFLIVFQLLQSMVKIKLNLMIVEEYLVLWPLVLCLVAAS